MGDALLAALAVAVLGALALAVLAGLTVVPFVLALHRGERRRLPPNRVGALALLGIGIGVGLSLLLVLRTSAPLPLAVLPLLLVGLGPLVASVVPPGWLGGPGEHEPGTAPPVR